MLAADGRNNGCRSPKGTAQTSTCTRSIQPLRLWFTGSPVDASNRSLPCVVVQGPRFASPCDPDVSGCDRRSRTWPRWPQWPVIGAHSGLDLSCGAAVRGGPVRRRFFSQDIPDDVVRKDLLGQQGLESGIFAFQRFQSLGIRSRHRTKGAALSRARGIADTMRLPQRLDRQACIGLTHEADDLFFAQPFLHVQSPSVETLDSKSTCSSKSG